VEAGYQRFSWAVICHEVAELNVTIRKGEILARESAVGPSRGSNRHTEGAAHPRGPHDSHEAPASFRHRAGRVRTRGWHATATHSGKTTQYLVQFEAIRGGRLLVLQNKQASALRYVLAKTK